MQVLSNLNTIIDTYEYFYIDMTIYNNSIVVFRTIL